MASPAKPTRPRSPVPAKAVKPAKAEPTKPTKAKPAMPATAEPTKPAKAEPTKTAKTPPTKTAATKTPAKEAEPTKPVKASKAASSKRAELVPYAAFLRGVMPTNCDMEELVACFEGAGLTNVSTVLGSGNVVFRAEPADETALRSRIESAMQKDLGRVFGTFVRSIEHLEATIADNPFANVAVAADAKRVVTFLRRAPKRGAQLPPERDGARILVYRDKEAFSAYVVSPKGPVFMKLIASTFGDDVTTRTWETLERVVAKARGSR